MSHYHLMVGNPLIDLEEPRAEFMFDDLNSAKKKLEEIKKNYFDLAGSEAVLLEEELKNPYEYTFCTGSFMMMLVECEDNFCPDTVS